MAGLVDALVAKFEIFVVGVLFVAVGAYLLALFHPLKRIITGYLSALGSFLFGELADSPLASRARIVIILGLVYYAGMLGNVLAYWVMQPTHIWIMTKPAETMEETDPLLYIRPLDRSLPEGGFEAYKRSLRSEVDWINLKIDSAKDILDYQVKYQRLLRGSAVFALCIALIAALKALLGFFGFLLELVARDAPDFEAYGAAFHRSFVEDLPADKERPAADRPAFTRRLLLYPNLIFLVFSTVGYIATVRALHAVEVHYHLQEDFGPESARAAIRTAKSSEPPGK